MAMHGFTPVYIYVCVYVYILLLGAPVRPTLTKMHLEGQESSIKILMTTKYDNYQANPVKRKGMMWCTSNLRVSI